MDYDDEDLKNTISKLTDEQLVRMLTVERDEYRKEALELAEAEVKSRTIPLSEVPREISNQTDQVQGNQFNHTPDADLPTPSAQSRTSKLPWLFLATSDKELKKRISHLNEEQLVRMLTVDCGEYRKETLELAEAEVRARGMTLSEPTRGLAVPSKQDQEGHSNNTAKSPVVNLDSPFSHLRARSLPIWLFLAVILFVFSAGPSTHGRAITAGGGVLFSVVIDTAVVGWICWQCIRRNIDSPRLFGPMPRDLPTWAFVTLAIPLLALDAGTGWLTLWLRYYLILLFGSNPITNWLGSSSRIGFRLDFWIIVRTLMTVGYGPAIEETVFRGLLLHRWALKWGLKAGVLGSSLAFALIHPRPIGPFIFGLVMAVLYLRTRSLWVAIACHATYNALVVFLHTIESVKLNGALCFIVAVPAFLLFLHRYWPDQEVPLPYFDRPAGAGEAAET